MIRIPYSTPSERDTIIAEQIALGYYLIEEESHLDGTFLLFEDDPTYTTLRDARNSDAFVQKIFTASPSEIAAYIDANMTTLAEAKVLFKKLVIVTVALARITLANR